MVIITGQLNIGDLITVAPTYAIIILTSQPMPLISGGSNAILLKLVIDNNLLN